MDGRDQKGNGVETIISVAEDCEIRSSPSRITNPQRIVKSASLMTPSELSEFQKKSSINGSFLRRRQFSRSVFSKPKSRFGEQSLDASAIIEAEKNGLNLVEADDLLSPILNALVNHPFSKELSPSLKAEEEAMKEEEEILKTVDMIQKRSRKVRGKVVIEWVVFICISILLIACNIVEKLENTSIAGLRLWKWCVLAMVTVSGMLVSRWIMNFSVFIFERNFLMKKKVLYLVHGLKKSVQVFVWLGMILTTWMLLFNNHLPDSGKNHIFLHRVKATLISLLVGAFLWFVKTLLLKLLAMNFHVNRFFDRIQEAFFYQYVVQTLSGQPVLDGVNQKDKAQLTRRLSLRNWKTTKATDHKHAITIEEVYRLKKEKVSTWTMKILIDGISSSGLRTISKQLDEVANYGEPEQNNDMEINSEMEAIAAGIRIFRNVVDSDDKFIDEESLSRFMIKEEVDLVFQILDASETRQIDKRKLTEWVVKVYNGRKTLAHALNDTKTAIKQLNKLVTLVLVCLTGVIWLLLVEIATSKVLLFLSSQLLLAAFIFGNTCKTIFECIIFVFIMHPYDVGDRCSIDDKHLIVEEMNILSTVFLKPNNEKVYYPNTVLSSKAISNFNRSPDMGNSICFYVDFSTTAEQIAELSDRMKKYFDENPQFFHPSFGVGLSSIDDLSKLALKMPYNFTMNFQEYGETRRRNSLLMMELKKTLEELGIKYTLLPQEVHLKNIGA